MITDLARGIVPTGRCVTIIVFCRLPTSGRSKPVYGQQLGSGSHVVEALTSALDTMASALLRAGRCRLCLTSLAQLAEASGLGPEGSRFESGEGYEIADAVMVVTTGWVRIPDWEPAVP